MSVSVQAIASGSNGNCFLIQSEDQAVLIDAGISRKRIVDSLNKINVPLSKITGILVTHAHSDHISGLPVLKRYLDAPMYATAGTISELYKMGIKNPEWHTIAKDFSRIEQGKILDIGDFKIITMHAEHDSPGTVGYRIHHKVENTPGVTVSVLTDTGKLNDRDIWRLARSDLLLLESNHNLELLKNSRRPNYLKSRVRANHLSNDQAADILSNIGKYEESKRIKGILLGHLSGECNSPDLIRDWVRNWQKRLDKNWNFYMCPRDNSSDLITISPETIKEEKKFAGYIDF